LRQTQRKQGTAKWLQRLRVNFPNQLHPRKRRGSRYGSRRRIDEGPIHSWSAIAAAKFALDTDDFSYLGGQIREVSPRQLELRCVAGGSLRASNFSTFQLEALEGWEIAHPHPGLQVGLREGRPEHMQGSGAERCCAELLTTAGIQVEFDCIAVPNLTVRSAA